MQAQFSVEIVVSASACEKGSLVDPLTFMAWNMAVLVLPSCPCVVKVVQAVINDVVITVDITLLSGLTVAADLGVLLMFPRFSER